MTNLAVRTVNHFDSYKVRVDFYGFINIDYRSKFFITSEQSI